MTGWSVVAAGDREHLGLFDLGPFLLAGELVIAAELAVVQPRVEAFRLQQIPVRAALDDLAVVDHQDLVGRADRAQAVGDHEAGASLHEPQ